MKIWTTKYYNDKVGGLVRTLVLEVSSSLPWSGQIFVCSGNICVEVWMFSTFNMYVLSKDKEKYICISCLVLIVQFLFS